MDRKAIVEKLVLLNSHNPADCEGDLDTLCDINVRLVCDQSHVNFQEEGNLNTFNNHDDSTLWKYVSLNFYFLNLLKENLDSTPASDVLSVQHTKLLKNVLKNIIGVGIRCNLLPKLPTYRKLPGQYVKKSEPILNSYNRLAATTFGLLECLRCAKLRSVILSGCLKVILTAMYQIVYCPLKKPDVKIANIKDPNVFVMTSELYDRFVKEKSLFKQELKYLEGSVLKSLYVRETMLLPENNSALPLWFMRAIAQNLEGVVRSPNGIETIVLAMMDPSIDYDRNDRAKVWKSLDVIAKLVLSFRNKPEFETVICDQLIGLINIKDHNGKYIVHFENVYVACVKNLFVSDQDVCHRVLLPAIFSQIHPFVDKSYEFSDGTDITDMVLRIIRIFYSCFVDNTSDSLPIELLAPSIGVIVALYTVSASHTPHLSAANELRDILIKYLCHEVDKNQFFDMFLFNIIPQGVKTFRDDIYVENKEDILLVRISDLRNSVNINSRGDILMNLCKSKSDLSIDLFIYLLNVTMEYEKYLSSSNRRDLLEIEEEFALDEGMQRKLAVYRLLSQLAEDRLIQDHIRENPTQIIRYLRSVLNKALVSGIHKSDNYDSDDFQTVFTLVMILQALVANADKYDHFNELLDVLRTLFRESTYLEFRILLKNIIEALEGGKCKSETGNFRAKSEFEKVLEDVCDPLLPVRGHALMALTTLIENKDAEAMQRKNYILNIFQQNLKDEDSFIYLSAINGLAAMGFVFPDIVLNTLTGEYTDFTKNMHEDATELRMKLGEILVRVTKSLGEITPKYKSLLLNTFLVGTKDDDHLIRASALSNLAALCKVLGYKLGTIVVEVLVCIHAVISTDKAIEARRAAVTVIRQLLAGLEVEMVTFLKDHILEIYRTLKVIYEGDRDDVMRLQAQLALEELNDNVKKFLAVAPRLEVEKTFVLPDTHVRIKEF